VEVPCESSISLWHEGDRCIVKDFEKVAVTNNNYIAVQQNLTYRFRPCGF